MTTQQHIFRLVTEHLQASDKNRIAVAAPGARRVIVYGPADLAKMKAEGSGIRAGRVFLFACQIRFAHIA